MINFNKLYRASMSHGLYQYVKTWYLDNYQFPPDKLELLKRKLEEKNYRKALETLEVEFRGVEVLCERYHDQPLFFAEWFIRSAGPPLARTLIYRFMSRQHLEHIQIFPPIAELIVFRDRACTTGDSGHMFCLPQELPHLKFEAIEKAWQEAERLVFQAAFNYDQARKIVVASTQP